MKRFYSTGVIRQRKEQPMTSGLAFILGGIFAVFIILVLAI